MKYSNLPVAEEYPVTSRLNGNYEQLSTEYHAKTESLWVYMQGEQRPCFTWPLLTELHKLLDWLENYSSNQAPIKYVIGASAVNGVFSLGGDLENFIRFIRASDNKQLEDYAYASVDIGYRCYKQFNRNITSIALIEGDCYGGGFEAALSCNIVIAEESAKFCFPEITFNLFPGMGAYSYLMRRVAPHVAEKIISSGRVYTGRELFDMGVIDRCACNGEGHQETLNFIAQHRRQQHGRVAMHKARQIVQPLSLAELKQVTDIWVNAALQLDNKSLRVMERFARAQQKRKFEKRDNKVINLVA
jgi:DSF synthase